MNDVLEICAELPEIQFGEGDDIIVEGGDGKSLFVLKSGAVEILKGDTQVNVVTSAGAIFGEVSVLLESPHMATVRTLQPSVFYAIEDAASFLQDHPEINLPIAAMLARRLNSVTTYLVDLKDQFQSHKNHLGMVDEVLESLLQDQKGQN
jgi:CRP/FNR family cyclic AMP-dependent transcriptional regulator